MHTATSCISMYQKGICIKNMTVMYDICNVSDILPKFMLYHCSDIVPGPSRHIMYCYCNTEALSINSLETGGYINSICDPVQRRTTSQGAENSWGQWGQMKISNILGTLRLDGKKQSLYKSKKSCSSLLVIFATGWKILLLDV